MSTLTAAEQLEAMINGTYVDENQEVDTSVNEEETETDVEETDETVEPEETEDDNTDSEDTDLDTDSDEEEDTEQENDDSAEDTSETDEEDQEENSQEEDETSKEESENTDSEPNYKEFYEKVALAKFTANGKEVEGFKDPADLIRAQQMLHGYSDKMKVFKEYKKLLTKLSKTNIMYSRTTESRKERVKR